MYSQKALKMKAILDDVKKIVHPDKPTDKKVPHQQIGALEFLDHSLRNTKVDWDSDNSVPVCEIAVNAVGPGYDPKVRESAAEVAALALAQSHRDSTIQAMVT